MHHMASSFIKDACHFLSDQGVHSASLRLPPDTVALIEMKMDDASRLGSGSLGPCFYGDRSGRVLQRVRSTWSCLVLIKDQAGSHTNTAVLLWAACGGAVDGCVWEG